MSEMVERVAQAICTAKTLDCHVMARAAIEVMREPTDRMRYAVPPRVAELLTYRDIGDTWKAMVDEVLSEKTE